MKEQPIRDTKQSILDAAEALILTRGFNGFSYKDIADVVGIRKASIHHHYPSKELLGATFVEQYFSRFQAWKDQVADMPVDGKLKALLEMFKRVSDNAEKICPMGMLTAEYPTLPRSVQDALRQLLGDMDQWLVQVLEQGQAEHTLSLEPRASVMAKVIVNAMSASMKMARVFHDVEQLEQVFDALMAMIRNPNQPTTPAP